MSEEGPMTLSQALLTIVQLSGARHDGVNWPVAVALAARAAEGHGDQEDRLMLALGVLLNTPSLPMLSIDEAAKRVGRLPLTQRRVVILEAPPGDEPIADILGRDVVQGSMSLLADADEAFVFRGDKAVCIKHRDVPVPRDGAAIAIQRQPVRTELTPDLTLVERGTTTGAHLGIPLADVEAILRMEDSEAPDLNDLTDEEKDRVHDMFKEMRLFVAAEGGS